MAGGERVTLVGSGLGGALMALFFGKAGYPVDVYERRQDPRFRGMEQGRSINLAISTRGLHALRQVGLEREILDMAVPMRGRMIHAERGDLAFQPYGTERHQVINSVSRGALNLTLINAAGTLPNVRFHFGKRCTGLDLETATANFVDENTGKEAAVQADLVIGADGAFSEVRRSMQRLDRFDYEQSYLAHGYKELSIPALAGGGFPLEKNALHIWPRGGFMMIALPNKDGSFTCTCFWPHDGPKGFTALETGQDVIRYFSEVFPDAVPLMPTIASDYFQNPTSSLVTIRCRPWHYEDRIGLLGDAAHAIVPFYGQGANAAFEDCVVLDECIREHAPNWEAVFTAYEGLRKENADSLADLALANFVEMRDRTASRLFLFGKKLEKGLHRLFPSWFVPLYFMVTFSRIPYAQAARKASLQWNVVKAIAGGGILALLVLVFLGLWVKW